MALNIVAIREPRTAMVQSDAYIPLDIDWVVPGSVRPLYYRIHGNNAGDFEVKVEPLTGEIVGFVVIDNPTHHQELPDVVTRASSAKQGSVRVDVKDWDPNPDNVPQLSVVRISTATHMGEDEDHLYYSWGNTAPKRVVMAGDAGVAISESGTVAGIVACKSGSINHS